MTGLEVSHARGGWPESEKAFEGVSGILLFADGGGGHPFVQKDRLAFLADYMRRGVGLMCAHFAVEVAGRQGRQAEFQTCWIGGYYEHQFSCNPMWKPEFTEFPTHPISRGVKPFSVRDEWYFNMRFRPDTRGLTPILTAKPSDATRDGPYVYPRGPYPHIQKAKGRAETMMWAMTRREGALDGRPRRWLHGRTRPPQLASRTTYRKVVLNAAPLGLPEPRCLLTGVASRI